MTEKLSKTLSYILRHNPSSHGLTMDRCGWVEVQALVDALVINTATLVSIVQSDTKGRYQFDSEGLYIRATQGHSVPVNLELTEFHSEEPYIYHGTATRFLDNILENGLDKQSRNHVHLSPSVETALQVGKRHGSPVILAIDYKEMQKDGLRLYVSFNNVVLTDHVPVKYIKVLEN